MELLSKSDEQALQSLGLVLERLHKNDLEAWFDHVAEVFASTGRGYFMDHYEAEPNLSSILVVKHPSTNVILSTMRYFDQRITLGSTEVRCAGVGEVSTKQEWRGKGLASILLRALQAVMRENSFHVSSLHTSSVGFYSKFGYELIPIEDVVATIVVKPWEGELAVLKSLDRISREWNDLHTSLVHKREVQGLLTRSDDCWLHRVPKEVQRLCGRQPLLKTFSPTPLKDDVPFSYGCGFQWTDKDSPSKIAVFLSRQCDATDKTKNEIKIREFIASPELVGDADTLKLVFISFIRASAKPEWDSFEIKCPGAIWRKFVEPFSWCGQMGPYVLDEVKFNYEDGIMYKSLDGSTSLEPLRSKEKHAFFALDSF